MKCAVCGNFAQHFHHVIYRSKWPEGERVQDNLMPVCADCHIKLHDRKVNVPKYYWNRANQAYGAFLLERKQNNPLETSRLRKLTPPHKTVQPLEQISELQKAQAEEERKQAARDFRKQQYQSHKEKRKSIRDRIQEVIGGKK